MFDIVKGKSESRFGKSNSDKTFGETSSIFSITSNPAPLQNVSQNEIIEQVVENDKNKLNTHDTIHNKQVNVELKLDANELEMAKEDHKCRFEKQKNLFESFGL